MSDEDQPPQSTPIALATHSGGEGPGRRARAVRTKRRTRRLGPYVAIAALWAIIAAAFFVPMPYVVDRPGPTVDVLSASEGTARIEITGTDPSTGEPVPLDSVAMPGDGTGQLRMVTVSESGGPGNRLNSIQLIQAWFDQRSRVVPYDQAYPASVTRQQIDEAAAAQMASSQQAASVVALESMGWTVPAVMTIEGAVPGSNAEGKVEQGDIMVSVTTPDGVEHLVDSAAVPFALMKTQPVGSDMTVHLTRNGQTLDVPVTSVSG